VKIGRFVLLMSVLFGLLQVVAPAVSAQDAPAGVPKGAEAATVSAVANGGTISVVLSDGSSRNVGLIGVSAPEVPTATAPGQCYGAEARSYLESLAVPGSVVYLEKDSKIQEKDETLLRFVWIVPADGGKAFLVNTKMVRDGYADVGQGGGDSKYAARLDEAEQKAKDGDKGAWGACGQIHKANELTEEQIKAQYQAPADMRDLFVRTGTLMGQKILVSGTVRTIKVAGPGRGFSLGDQVPVVTGTMMQIEIPLPTGGSEWAVVGFDGDTAGIYEGSWVTVWGTVVGTDTFTNAMGGQISQPLILADYVQLG
jgi:endonuclease YncB( thermonuclease family)